MKSINSQRHIRKNVQKIPERNIPGQGYGRNSTKFQICSDGRAYKRCQQLLVMISNDL